MLGAAFVNHALGIAHDDVFQADAEVDIVGGAADGRRARAVEHHLDVFDLLAADFQRVQQAGAADDRGAVLIVVEDRDLHGLAQGFFDVEALRRLDVFQVDAAERRFQNLAGADDLVGVRRVELDIEDVDIGEALEQHGFAFHHRLAGESADIAKAEDGGSVGNHSHQVALGGVLVSEAGIALDFQAWYGDARRIGETEIPLCAAGLGGDNRQFSGGG